MKLPKSGTAALWDACRAYLSCFVAGGYEIFERRYWHDSQHIARSLIALGQHCIELEAEYRKVLDMPRFPEWTGDECIDAFVEGTMEIFSRHQFEENDWVSSDAGFIRAHMVRKIDHIYLKESFPEFKKRWEANTEVMECKQLAMF
jgi:hypothetical protein